MHILLSFPLFFRGLLCVFLFSLAWAAEGGVRRRLFDEGPNNPNLGVEPTGILYAVREEYKKLETEILDEWGHEYLDKLFTGKMSFSDAGEDVVSKMMEAVILQRRFVIGFTGTSVTAGHDNLFEVSYPRVVNSQLGRLFNLAGSTLEGRNGAMGNNPTTPYGYCLSRYTGADADIVVWEAWMMIAGSQCVGKEIEAFIRTALLLPKQPAVLILANVAGEHNCDYLPDRDWDRESDLGNCYDGRGPDLMAQYREFGLHYINPMFQASRHTCGDERYSRKHLLQDGKAGPSYANWHPGSYGHKLAGSMLTMHYAQVLLRGLEELDAVIPHVTVEDLRDERTQDAALRLMRLPSRGSNAMVDTMPPPLLCGDWLLCKDAEKYKCLTSFEPNYDGKNSDLLSHVVDTQVAAPARIVDFPAEARGGWAVIQNENDPVVFPDDGRKYPIDNKYVIVGDKSSGLLTLEFEVTGEGAGGGGQMGGVGICRNHFVLRALFEDETAVRFYIDGIPVQNVINWDRPSQVGDPPPYGDQCVWMDRFVGPGTHRLQIEPLKDSPEPLVAICYLFYPK